MFTTCLLAVLLKNNLLIIIIIIMLCNLMKLIIVACGMDCIIYKVTYCATQPYCLPIFVNVLIIMCWSLTIYCAPQ